MQAQHAIIRSAMRRQMLARFEDGEHCRRQAGNLVHDTPGFRAGLDVLFRLHAETEQKERLPAIIGRDRFHIGRNILKGRQLTLTQQNRIQLLADGRPFLLDLGGPGKVALS